MTKCLSLLLIRSDDEVVGMGSTIAKYVKEGNTVVTIIFSYGEKSTPHIKEEYTKELRIKETKEVDKLLGRRSIFLGLEDSKIQEGITKKVEKQIENLIKKYKPSKIFTTSSLDPHKDHRIVNKIITELLDKMNYKADLFTFEVWNVINETHPRLYVDVSKYFKIKIQAIKLYASQQHFLLPLWLPIFIRAKVNGYKNKCKYAEVFYKIR